MTLIARRLLPLAGSILLALSAAAPAQTAAPLAHGINVANMDTSVRPGDDFYTFANGGFVARTKLPPDRATIGVFTVLSDLSFERTANIIQDAAKANAAPGTDQRKIADLYHSYMDEAAIETHGLATLKPHLAEIAAISSPQQLAHALGLSLRSDVDALNNTNFHTPNIFGLWVAPDFNDPDRYAPYLLQGGLQLPNRDYYLSDSARMKEIRTTYQTHIAAMFDTAGLSDADARAARVLALETEIAKVHISLADSEDIHKANNPWSPADFTAKAPGLDWPEFFRAAGLDKQSSFIVWQPSAFTGEAALVSSQPIDAWKDLLAYHLIAAYAAGTSKALADQNFVFFGQTLSGTPQQRPRDIRGARLVSVLLGDPVGQIYTARYFSPEAKAQAEALVSNIIAAFRQRLENLTWMAPATKAEALAKLGTLKVGIGYPDHWRSYAAYEVTPDNLFLNLWRSGLFEYHYDVGRIGTPVNRREWTMTPQTVNAVNLPLHNGLNFPAAILQPPFFDPKAPAAANYGAIGTVIGHEISHTFDSEGAAFDSKGRVRNWWTPDDLAHFNSAAAALAAQYDTYKPFPDLAVNGRQTLGENIADVAGLTAAFDGYHASLKGKTAPMDGNFTGDQQFFIAFGQNWGSVVRDAALRQQVLADPHAPARFRAATVRNNDGWYTAFDIKPTDKLYLAPKDRVQLW
jgi:endothelin-converting enzyme/putative endopeptidase